MVWAPWLSLHHSFAVRNTPRWSCTLILAMQNGRVKSDQKLSELFKTKDRSAGLSTSTALPTSYGIKTSSHSWVAHNQLVAWSVTTSLRFLPQLRYKNVDWNERTRPAWHLARKCTRLSLRENMKRSRKRVWSIWTRLFRRRSRSCMKTKEVSQTTTTIFSGGWEKTFILCLTSRPLALISDSDLFKTSNWCWTVRLFGFKTYTMTTFTR